MNPSPPARAIADRWAVPALLLTVCLAFGGTLGYGFVWDDHEQVVDNHALRSWESSGRFWTTDVLGTTRAAGERSHYYRPLFFVQYLVLYQLFGLEATAWHLGAVGLHFLAAVAAWHLVRRLGLAPGPALLAALFFVAHPVHTESVSWIAAAYNNPPTAILSLLALAGHLRWIRRSNPWTLAGASLGFAAALCIKETALSFLLLVPLVEVLARPGESPAEGPGEKRGTTLRSYGAVLATLALVLVAEAAGWLPSGWGPWPVLALQATACAGALVLAGRAAPRPSILAWSAYLAVTLAYFQARRLLIGTTLGVVGTDVGWGTLAATQPLLLGYYLRFIVWPWGLSPSYPLRYVTAEPIWGTAVLGAAVLLLAAYGAWRLARRRAVIGLGLLWLAACLAPALYTLPFRETYLVHHRYLYLAILGPCVILAWTLHRAPWSPPIRAAVGIAAVAGLALASAAQNRFWRSDSDIWQRVAAVDPANVAASDWLGRQALDAGRIDEAERWFRRSVGVAPPSGRGAYNLGLLLQRERRDAAAALPWYETAMSRLRRDHPEENELYLRSAGNHALALAETGRREEALRRLVELAGPPYHHPDSVRNAVILLVERGDFDRAAHILSAALAARPGDAVLRQMHRDLVSRRPLP